MASSQTSSSSSTEGALIGRLILLNRKTEVVDDLLQGAWQVLGAQRLQRLLDVPDITASPA